MSTLVILPTYNEKENLAELISAILNSYPNIHVLIVDDNSPDGTGKIAGALVRKHSDKVFVLHRLRKEGLGRAYLAGFNWALGRDYEHIITMDADWSHNPADIPRLLEASKKNDFVIGSRYAGGIHVLNWPLKRLILSILGNCYVRFVTRLKVADCTSGFQCLKRKVLENLELKKMKSSGYSFLIEMKYQAWRKNFSLKEIPIVFYERRAGTTKMNSAIALEAIFTVWKLVLRDRLRLK